MDLLANRMGNKDHVSLLYSSINGKCIILKINKWTKIQKGKLGAQNISPHCFFTILTDKKCTVASIHSTNNTFHSKSTVAQWKPFWNPGSKWPGKQNLWHLDFTAQCKVRNRASRLACEFLYIYSLVFMVYSFKGEQESPNECWTKLHLLWKYEIIYSMFKFSSGP